METFLISLIIRLCWWCFCSECDYSDLWNSVWLRIQFCPVFHCRQKNRALPLQCDWVEAQVLKFFFYKNYAELCVIPTFVFLNQFLVLTILFNFRDWMKAAFFLSNIYKDTLASLCCVCQVKEIFRYPLWPYHVRSLVHLFQLTLTRGKQLLCITEKNCRDKWCN